MKMLYSDKLVHVQVVINYQYSVAPMCTFKDTLAHNLGTPYLDDIMSYNSLTTLSLRIGGGEVVITIFQ